MDIAGVAVADSEFSSQKNYQLSSNTIDPILLVHHANKISDLNKIGNDIGFDALTFGLVDLTSVQPHSLNKLHEELTDQAFYTAEILVDTKNPTLLLFLIPLASIVLLLNSNNFFSNHYPSFYRFKLLGNSFCRRIYKFH